MRLGHRRDHRGAGVAAVERAGSLDRAEQQHPQSEQVTWRPWRPVLHQLGHDAEGVRCGEGLDNADADGDGLVDRRRAAPQLLRERLPVHKLHNEPGLAILVEDVKDLDDVRMVNARRALRLDHDALDQLSCFSVVDRVWNMQFLDRYRAS